MNAQAAPAAPVASARAGALLEIRGLRRSFAKPGGGEPRALVVHPNPLPVDEPFSALDVLAVETLRADFLDLWGEGRLPVMAAIRVPHDIEEAVPMCSRVLVFSRQAGRIAAGVAVDLPHPRGRADLPVLAGRIRRVPGERASRTAPRRRFLDELEDRMTEKAAEQALAAAASRGRCAEVFACGDRAQRSGLENPS